MVIAKSVKLCRVMQSCSHTCINTHYTWIQDFRQPPLIQLLYVVQHFMHFSLLLQGVSLIARLSLSFFVTCVCPKSENREGKPENEARKERPQYPNNIIFTHSWNIFFFSSVRLLVLQWLSKGFWLYPDWQYPDWKLLVTFHLPTVGNG